ncbi:MULTISPECIES: RHS repeat domain-containing protein [unclassified Leptospira]|nr:MULTISPECIES: RHS repeat-associated core domain-containing protein [unclassified Leptospira]EKO77142.1 RHS repeat-associated core domain protein [Leptospira sp. Fiocruz LV3954]EMI62838.1 RHS repeat-associated core domain protein [Leptospira sp. Fiocruz LV4135]
MFFFHPDHLGSITMITDGAGNPASGPEPGTSFVSYEPYGSIIRNDSYGPDIFRYKFTGQIEDKETGLYYYKARYYEPTLGRFLQADSVIDSDAPNGQNRYMYVEGNPVNYRDPSGHVSGAGLMHMMNRMIGHAMGKDFGKKGINKVGHNIWHGVNGAFKRTFTSTKNMNLKNFFDGTYFSHHTDLAKLYKQHMRNSYPPGEGSERYKNDDLKEIVISNLCFKALGDHPVCRSYAMRTIQRLTDDGFLPAPIGQFEYQTEEPSDDNYACITKVTITIYGEIYIPPEKHVECKKDEEK